LWTYTRRAPGVAIHHLDPVHGLQQKAVGIALLRQEAVVGEFHVLGHELAAVEGGLVVPRDAFPEMEDIGGVIQRFPVFGHIGLDGEGAREAICHHIVALS
jgi:hypothetical protein